MPKANKTLKDYRFKRTRAQTRTFLGEKIILFIDSLTWKEHCVCDIKGDLHTGEFRVKTNWIVSVAMRLYHLQHKMLIPERTSFPLFKWHPKCGRTYIYMYHSSSKRVRNQRKVNVKTSERHCTWTASLCWLHLLPKCRKELTNRQLSGQQTQYQQSSTAGLTPGLQHIHNTHTLDSLGSSVAPFTVYNLVSRS